MVLNAHLSDHARVRRGSTNQARFFDRMGKRFLAINMFAKSHGRHRNRRMHMIWSGNTNAIDFRGHFLKHLTPIRKSAGVGMQFGGLGQTASIDIA